MIFKKRVITIAALTIATLNVNATPQTVPIATCSATGPGALICGGIALTAHEAVNCLNGKECVGGNGEIIKLVGNVTKEIERHVNGNGAVAEGVRHVANEAKKLTDINGNGEGAKLLRRFGFGN